MAKVLYLKDSNLKYSKVSSSKIVIRNLCLTIPEILCDF